MYALINQMNDRILSRHRTLAAASRAGERVQPRERGSYLPVSIKVYVNGAACGHECVQVPEEEYDAYVDSVTR